jgi:hypothetical protein
VTYDMSDYVDVKTRLTEALAKYPDLRITEHRPTVVEVGADLFIECAVTVARHPDDPVPVTAYMYEPYPGRTPYTKLSEQANGSTSALGRALGFMGFGIKASIASANEVRNRAAEEQYPDQGRPQASHVDELQQRRTGTAAGNGNASPNQLQTLRDMAVERGLDMEILDTLTAQEASDLIKHIKPMPRVKK